MPGSSWRAKRSALCRAIASLPTNASDSVVSAVLSPILSQITCVVSDEDELASDLEEVESRLAKVDDDGVTPLMVSCDKSQLACLNYIDRNIDEYGAVLPHALDVLGRPLDVCSTRCGGNGALHYAAVSGCAGALDVLSAMLTKHAGEEICSTRCEPLDEAETPQKPISRGFGETDSRLVPSYVLQLLSQPNDHGDTPLMMACAAGHLDALRHWVDCMLQIPRYEESSQARSRVGDSFSEIRNVFELRNESGDSALSLACGHGHSSVVGFLVNEHPSADQGGTNIGEERVLVSVKHEHISECKGTLQDIDSALRIMENGESSLKDEQRNEYETRRECVRRCLVILQVRSAKVAQRKMEEFLVSESKGGEHVKGGKVNSTVSKGSAHKKKGRPRKKTTKPDSQEQSLSCAESERFGDRSGYNVESGKYASRAWDVKEAKQQTMEGSPISENDGIPVTASQYVTLDDGSVVSMNKSSTLLSHHSDLISPDELNMDSNDASRGVTKTLDEMLRDRCREPRNDSEFDSTASKTATAAKHDKRDMTVDGVMDSLCLDASMLLLTPHGMAMNLSPSQLEAVHTVLKNQLGAAEEAKEIQHRLLSRSDNGTSSSNEK